VLPACHTDTTHLDFMRMVSPGPAAAPHPPGESPAPIIDLYLAHYMPKAAGANAASGMFYKARHIHCSAGAFSNSASV
jgi:hypothetical protein